jgi:4-hydroxy-tetrahydrodipicolinate synthase
VPGCQSGKAHASRETVASESSPSPPAVARLVSGLDVPVFGGLGGTCLLDELALGAAGAMTGFSVPEGLLACVAAFRSGGFAAARDVWRDYLPLVNFEFQRGIALGLRKHSLVLRGLIEHDAVRPPAPQAPSPLLDLLAEHLRHTPGALPREAHVSGGPTTGATVARRSRAPSSPGRT